MSFLIINKYWWHTEKHLYTNNEPDLLQTLTDLSEILDFVGYIQKKKKIFGDGFNVIFDSFLKVQGENQILKNTL